MNNANKEIKLFVKDWKDSPEKNKKAFVCLKDYLESKPGVYLDFLPRAGITYSLRAVHEKQKNNPLFALVDVIEDQPRWLSVCFYSGMISDPEEKGIFIPGGILGDDAVCFDLEEYNEDAIQYIKARFDEAYQSFNTE
jgi:hypothetical protein